MKKALILIKENKICQIADNEFPVHQDLKWVDCDDDVTEAWRYDGKKFTTPINRAINIEFLTDEEKLFELRQERNRRLSECDWTQLIDAKGDVEAWAKYRQALRDLPQTTKDLNNIYYPIPPNA
jgi:hypothetical protein